MLRHDGLSHVGRGAGRRNALAWRRRGVRQQLYGTTRRRRPASLSACLPVGLLSLLLLLLLVVVCLALRRGALLGYECDGGRQRGAALAVGDGTQPVAEGWPRAGKVVKPGSDASVPAVGSWGTSSAHGYKRLPLGSQLTRHRRG